jgi:hypothetical protein
MRDFDMLTPAEVRKAGWEALREKLGPVGALRFMLDHERGEGNYTELRREIFRGKTVKDIVADMKQEGYV